MKKLLLAVALLFATSMLFSQIQQQTCDGCSIQQLSPEYGMPFGNLSIVDQIYGYNDAEVHQVGLGNYSRVTQFGFENAYVNQIGNGNTAITEQHGFMDFGVINQTGSFNFAKQVSGNLIPWGTGYNSALATQSGIGNLSFQTQNGYLNNATVMQVGNGNYAEQNQFNPSYWFMPIPNYASIVQMGIDNESKQDQVGGANFATSYQTGWGNTAVSDQATYGWGMNTSFINQIGGFFGGYNLACVTQDAFGGTNISNISQVGSYNFADVNQDAGFMGMNASTISQLGVFNSACVTQDAFWGGMNTSFVDQVGMGNHALVTQSTAFMPF
ncbi:hypothetical protein [Lutibacter sp.]|uniref:hypothetical protein n=1 Tax=Lutibacter sp. TaxID=1925666 RepID=UPI003562CCE7